ncbi:indoleacetamide hydrolase [Oceanobacter mangrovi]|uniref:indoleacetamide hydrolase n=1 Tax=Oceanobacter mangrovi TaxID=2862510 RepID=UPI001C8EDD64|nr:indoleacetamide hydrolase [Oceanobacter mangrovi]
MNQAIAAAPYTSIQSMQQALLNGELTVRQLVADSLQRIHAGAHLNLFVSVDADAAMAAADAADQAIQAGVELLPLTGVTLVIKDNIHTANLPCTAGCPALADFIPDADAPVVKRLRDQGAIILGKTNMHELAFGATGYNTSFNTGALAGIRNAYDAERIAGGSSSGSAAAVAARMAMVALGTDTGGSMRIPPALNGCASLRPSSGRYPDRGMIPISHSRDTAGPMALTMTDVALLDGLICDDQQLEEIDLNSLRLGLPAGFWANLDDDTRMVMQDVKQRLQQAGVTLVEIADSQLQELNEKIGFPVVFHEAFDSMVEYLATQGPQLTLEQLVAGINSPDVKACYEQIILPRQLPTADGSTASGPVYEWAMNSGKPALISRYEYLFGHYQLDALIFPTTAVVAPKAVPEVSSPGNFDLLIQNTEPAASAGLPALQIPAGLGLDSGMPVGLEIDGQRMQDRRLLAIGIAIQALLEPLPAPQQSLSR